MRELRIISAGSVVGLVGGPFLLYHLRRCDDKYVFPCSLSHTIRGGDPLVRLVYGCSYACYLAALLGVATRRGSAKMMRTWALCVVGALHVVVSIPNDDDDDDDDEEKVEVDARRAASRGTLRTGVHYGSACCCVAGLGYGFSHRNSTTPSLKAFYVTSAAALAVALGVCNWRGPGGEDTSAPYWARVLFMVSEYGVFLAGAIAISQPLLCQPGPAVVTAL